MTEGEDLVDKWQQCDSDSRQRVSLLIVRIDAALAHKNNEIRELRRAAADALSGWRYIRAQYGDLDGVGWDRVEKRLVAALARCDYEGILKELSAEEKLKNTLTK